MADRMRMRLEGEASRRRGRLWRQAGEEGQASLQSGGKVEGGQSELAAALPSQTLFPVAIFEAV